MVALSPAQPYPGLRPFDFGDQRYFFGREAQTKALRLKVEARRLVAVVGRSGCGKSSLVRAGLVPALADDPSGTCWRIATFRPQGRPIAELTAALQALQADADTPEMTELSRSRLDAMLRRSSRGLIEAAGELGLTETGRLLIIVDQFEEIFRFENATGSDADEATAFVRLLIEAVGAEQPRIHVILTMRLDFLGDCARFQRLPEAISDGQFLVPNLARAERRAAIEKPAEECGKAVRPEVTQRLLNEIGDDPDQLPVLQHVLMRMWRQSDARGDITLDDYKNAGGVRNAISLHADEVFAGLPTAAHRRAAERLFKALSERDQRGRLVRRATRFADITAIVAGDHDGDATTGRRLLAEVIEAFRAPDCCFLMPPAGEDLAPDTLVDISHESLLRGWDRIVQEPGWIAEESRDGRIYRGLVETVDSGSTLPAGIASQRRQWWAAARPNSAWAQRYGGQFEKVAEFVQTSARRARLRRMATIGALVAFVAVSAAALFTGLYSWGAQRELDRLDSAYTKAAQAEREALAKAARLEEENTALAERLAGFNRELEQNLRQAQAVVPLSNQQVRADLDRLRAQSAAAAVDLAAQVAAIEQKTAAPAPVAAENTGFMWIGSAQRSNLLSTAGTPVPLSAVKPGEEYQLALDIYLRQGPPDRPAYTQQAALGVMPEGTRVRILAIEPGYTRPTGEQFWAQVRVVRLALPTVFFQFAGGSREQAQALSKALQDKGYRIPGEERTTAAAGRRAVVYFFAGQKPLAEQLANDVNQALQKLGYARLSVGIEQDAAATKSNPDGKLELWLEIPPGK